MKSVDSITQASGWIWIIHIRAYRRILFAYLLFSDWAYIREKCVHYLHIVSRLKTWRAFTFSFFKCSCTKNMLKKKPLSLNSGNLLFTGNPSSMNLWYHQWNFALSSWVYKVINSSGFWSFQGEHCFSIEFCHGYQLFTTQLDHAGWLLWGFLQVLLLQIISQEGNWLKALTWTEWWRIG